jgi:hypothetical protein
MPAGRALRNSKDMAGSAVDKFKGSLSIWAGTVTVQIEGCGPVQMGP